MICVFPVTRPTLIFPSDPKVFIGIQKKIEILSYATYPICGHFLLVLQLPLSYLKLYTLVLIEIHSMKCLYSK